MPKRVAYVEDYDDDNDNDVVPKVTTVPTRKGVNFASKPLVIGLGDSSTDSGYYSHTIDTESGRFSVSSDAKSPVVITIDTKGKKTGREGAGDQSNSGKTEKKEKSRRPGRDVKVSHRDSGSRTPRPMVEGRNSGRDYRSATEGHDPSTCWECEQAPMYPYEAPGFSGLPAAVNYPTPFVQHVADQQYIHNPPRQTQLPLRPSSAMQYTNSRSRYPTTSPPPRLQSSNSYYSENRTTHVHRTGPRSRMRTTAYETPSLTDIDLQRQDYLHGPQQTSSNTPIYPEQSYHYNVPSYPAPLQLGEISSPSMPFPSSQFYLGYDYPPQPLPPEAYEQQFAYTNQAPRETSSRSMPFLPINEYAARMRIDEYQSHWAHPYQVPPWQAPVYPFFQYPEQNYYPIPQSPSPSRRSLERTDSIKEEYYWVPHPQPSKHPRSSALRKSDERPSSKANQIPSNRGGQSEARRKSKHSVSIKQEKSPSTVANESATKEALRKHQSRRKSHKSKPSEREPKSNEDKSDNPKVDISHHEVQRNADTRKQDGGVVVLHKAVNEKKWKNDSVENIESPQPLTAGALIELNRAHGDDADSPIQNVCRANSSRSTHSDDRDSTLNEDNEEGKPASEITRIPSTSQESSQTTETYQQIELSTNSASTTESDLNMVHLLGDKTEDLATGQWESLLPLLPDSVKWDIEYNQAFQCDPCWSCTPDEDDNNIPDNIPLTIAGARVVIPVPYYYPIAAGVAPPPDPCPGFISPSAPLDIEIIAKIFLEFRDAIGFYLLLNGLLQIIIPEDFDYDWGYSHQPVEFGGLKVCYIPESMTPTAAKGTKASRSTTTEAGKKSSPNPSQTHGARPPVITAQKAPSEPATTPFAIQVGSSIEARVRGFRTRERFMGKIGIGLKLTSSLKPYLSISTHVATQALASAGFPLEEWPQKMKDVEIYASNGNVRIGDVAKTLDQHVEDFPSGFQCDTSLVEVHAHAAANSLKSPISLNWLSNNDWNNLRYDKARLFLLEDAEERGTRQAKNIALLPSQYEIVGQGILRNKATLQSFRERLSRSKHENVQQELNKWKSVIARSVLYRVYPDLRPPGGFSGTAVCIEQEPTAAQSGNGSNGPTAGLIGFQSFMQQTGVAGSRQRFTLEDDMLYNQLQRGRVAFYGAFQVPEELREHYTIL